MTKLTDMDNSFDRTAYRRRECEGKKMPGLDIAELLPLADSTRSLHHGRQYELYLSSVRLTSFDLSPTLFSL